MRKQKFYLAATFVLVLAVSILPAYAQTFTALHQFDSLTDGANPEGGVIRDAAGNLYGTTVEPGTIFKINTKGKESVLALINGGSNGIFPTGTLTQDQAGNLYGVAEGGGGAGVVYKMSPKGDETVLFAFTGGLGLDVPQLPAGGVILDQSGNIFGAAETGSDHTNCQKLGCGSIFQLDPAGNLELLHKFTGGPDGAYPMGPLAQDSDGNLYGVAQGGGDLSCPENFLFKGAGCGVVFKLDQNRNLTILHTFTGGGDGGVPQGGLLLDAAGNLFGTASKGGRSDNGTVFKIAKDGSYTVLHRFITREGRHPNGGLVADPAGNLFGTAQLGGDENDGTAFQLAPDGRVKVLHNFHAGKDGDFPLAGLFRDSAGHLYGTTVSNGLIQIVQGGNVFEITP